MIPATSVPNLHMPILHAPAAQRRIECEARGRLRPLLTRGSIDSSLNKVARSHRALIDQHSSRLTGARHPVFSCALRGSG